MDKDDYYERDDSYEPAICKTKTHGVSASGSNELLCSFGWGLRRHTKGEIVVTHKDGSGVLIREGTTDNEVGVKESLFYRMMDNFLTET